MAAKSSVDLKPAADTNTFPVPYQISNQPDGSLPDMQDLSLIHI